MLLGGGGRAAEDGAASTDCRERVILQHVTWRLQAWSPGLDLEPIGGSDREQLRMGCRWRPRGRWPALCWVVCRVRSPPRSSPRIRPCGPFTEGWGRLRAWWGPQAPGRPEPRGQQSYHKEGQTTGGWGRRGQWGQGPPRTRDGGVPASLGLCPQAGPQEAGAPTPRHSESHLERH